MSEIGRHLLVDLYECDADTLNDVALVERALRDAALAAHATALGAVFHQFVPQGASGVLLVAESHLSVHTWPEHRFAACDLFTCSPSLDADAALAVLRRAFASERVVVREILRGISLDSRDHQGTGL
ncbi:MAG: adenosylmethionine decarboxylase [Deltaproteobacteria bacterium]|nr:adenosylmethionine decarboxylase [Deltaproteobacteria bacterium]